MDKPPDLTDLIGQTAARTPDRIAIEMGRHTMTYRVLAQHVARMAEWLHRQGIRAGDFLGLHISDPYLDRVLILAALKIGAVSIQVTKSNADAIASIGPLKSVVSSTGHIPTVLAEAVRLLIPERAILEDSALDQNQEHWSPRVPSLPSGRLFLSSGTTGTPKGVLVDETNIGHRMVANRDRYKIDQSARTYSALGTGTNPGFHVMLITWWCGGSVILQPGRAARDAFEVAKRATHFFISPIGLKHFVHALPKLHTSNPDIHIFVGGGRLPIKLRDEAINILGSNINVIYGATEIGGGCLCAADHLDRHPGMVGKPRPGTVVEIVDEEDRPVPRGAEGRVRIKSDTMVEAYLNDPEATQSAFRNGWFYPGDLGSMQEDGMLLITGRISEIMNVGGVKVAPDVIENELAMIAGVTDTCALVLDGADGTEVLTVVVATAPNADWLETRKAVSTALRRFRDLSIVQVDHIPRNQMGKIPRAAFRQQLIDYLAKSQ